MSLPALLPLTVALPWVVAALIAAFAHRIPIRLADALALATALVVGGIAVALLVGTRDQPLVYWFGSWTPVDGIAIGIDFMVDTAGAAMAALSAVLVVAAFIFSLRYFDRAGALYHVLMLVFLGALCGFSLSGDLFNMFVFFEVMGAAAYALCGYKSEEPGPLQGALNFGITNSVGAFGALIGLGLLYGRTGALNLAQLGRTLHDQHTLDGLVIVAFVLLLTGFLLKAAVVPFHFWLADAHAVAPTPVCILFSGVMVETGLYAVVRVYGTVFAGLFEPHTAVLRGALVGIGVLTAVVGAVMCFLQHHIKRLLAFSTISHMGLMVIAFGLLTDDGLAGGSLYVLGHAAAKAPLFLAAGILLHRFGSLEELDLQGRGRVLPGVGLIFLAGAAGLAALPPFSTFLAETRIDEAAEKLGYSWLSWVAMGCAMLTAGAVLRVAGRVFLGWGGGPATATPEDPHPPEKPETVGGHNRVPAAMWLPPVVLLVAGVLLTFWPAAEASADIAAARLRDWAGYAALVIDGQPMPPVALPEHGSLLPGVVRGIANMAGALALAWVALAYRPAGGIELLAAPLRGLRRLHSGVINDYVAWLTVGTVGLGALFAWILR